MHRRRLVYPVVVGSPAIGSPETYLLHFGCTPDTVALQMASLLGAIPTLDALKKSNQRSLSWPVIDDKSAWLMTKREQEWPKAGSHISWNGGEHYQS